MIKDGLIKDKPSSWCKPGLDKKDPCFTCASDAMCTKLDTLTGKAKNTFMGGYKKHHRVLTFLILDLVDLSLLKVGGKKQSFHSRFGLRFSSCVAGDLCKVRFFFEEQSSHSQLPGRTKASYTYMILKNSG